MKFKWILLLLFFATTVVSAQQKIDSLSLDTLNDSRLRLMGMGERMIHSRDEQERLLNGRNFLITLGRSLRIKNAYYYEYDSIPYMSILKSPDNRFRIISWNIALNDGRFHYFGVIQLNPSYISSLNDTSNVKNFYPLIDRSFAIKNPLDTTLGPDYWWGAAYYAIHKCEYKNKTYYLLFGWNGSTHMTNKKVVDVLHFENNLPRFGSPIFSMNEARFKRPLKRLVYEFSNKGTMTLKISNKKNYLIVENIVPPRQQDYGKPETYLSDGSFEYFIWKKGMWEKKGLLKDFDIE
jgi:hypothetical protein